MARTPIVLAGLLAVIALEAAYVGIVVSMSLPADACARFMRRELMGDELALLGRVVAKRLAAFPTPDAPRFEQWGRYRADGAPAAS